MKRPIASLLVFSVLIPLAFAKTHKKGPDDVGRSNPGRGVNFYSLEKEIALGREMAEETETQARVVSDPVVTEYVNRIGQNVVRNSEAKVPFTIKVIDSNEVNAFALRGGFLFVNCGLILKADSEAELVSVMAHEIAHVAARHGTKQATRAAILNYATIPLVFMGGWAGYAVREAASVAVPLGFLQFSRAMEGQADHLGIEYLYKTGYDPTAFVEFFEKIETSEKTYPGTISHLFSSHPMTRDRIVKAQKTIQNEFKPLSQYVVDTSEFHRVRDRLEMLENRRQMGSGTDPRPRLKRRFPSGDEQNVEPSDDGNDRPTLKRREP